MQESLSLIIQSVPFLLRGALYTIGLSVVSMPLGLILGFFLALARLSRSRWLNWPARTYISFIRGTPLIVQLFLIFYGLPQVGITFSPITAALIGLTLSVAAYNAEIIRSAISSIDRGQWEAAATIGMTRFQTMRRVILPQAGRIALPGISNSFISLVKDTSLAATIQVPELFREAQLITARTFQIFAMYLSAAMIYWLLSTMLASLQKSLETRFNRHIEQRSDV
ncbi:cystine ABC transporter permease [Bartonella sp. HY329]|uniref:cystine ABC transporter permease n=1 Tax=unclassified Bartonella TaxID=2645622 RepID=UPI0021C7A40D|nr:MULTISPECIES: cystine ABC transporter permease [unclassified Bartonella]UXM95043.1 cystine ABC transporter permease [Bartonella sp. HY329]UXN09366.1 cystine ABC transporter permease [Bartonella sp. HY328]